MYIVHIAAIRHKMYHLGSSFNFFLLVGSFKFLDKNTQIEKLNYPKKYLLKMLNTQLCNTQMNEKGVCNIPNCSKN